MTFKSVLKITAALVLCAGAAADAQSPQSQPLVQAGNMVYLGKFSLPTYDAANVMLSYGGAALGMGADGQSLYFGCQDGRGMLARVAIPAIGGTANVLEPCAYVPNLMGIKPNDVNGIKLGGSLSWNGRLIVSAYTFYDGAGDTAFSHFAGAGGVASLVGPYRVGTELPAMVGGYMGVIPQEWRGLLGGPALTGKCCTSIIWRSSFGPSVSVFNPDHVGTQAPIPSTMLVGYPDAHKTLGPWDGVSQYYTGTMRLGGLAFPAGTRSVLFVARRGETFCYGSGAECSDPSDADKGTHGYPYRHVVIAYDANDLLAVKQGTKKYWEVVPYTQWTLTEMNNIGTADMSSAVYDPATRRFYITAGLAGGAPVVHVYEISNAVIPPPVPVEICGDGIDNDNDGVVDENCVEVCGDGIDNDSDGLVDENCVEICGDGIDNDKDGLVDENCVEICGDGIDNDKDGLVDETCATEGCGDNIDNDGDGLIDEGCATSTAILSAPVGLQGKVKGSTVTFQWEMPRTGGAVQGYSLEVGTAPGMATSVTALGSATTVSAPGIGPGTYFVRVRARNGSGQSAPSNEVVVTVASPTEKRGGGRRGQPSAARDLVMGRP